MVNDKSFNWLSDEEIEYAVIVELRQVIVKLWEWHDAYQGRIHSSTLSRLQYWASSRKTELKKFDEPEEGDTENIDAFAAVKAFSASLNCIVARMWAAFCADRNRVPFQLIQDLEELVETRVMAMNTV